MSEPFNPSSPQLTQENLQQLAEARKGLRKINRAVSVARMDGWIIAIFAGLTLLVGFTELTNIVIALVLGSVAYIELRGAKQLRRLEFQATRMLGFNQVGLGIGLILYSFWQMLAEAAGHGELSSAVASDPSAAQALAPYQNLFKQIAVLFYVCVMVVAVLGMGGMALYYFSRGKYVIKYLAETPPWIIAMQREVQ